jgi:hypothetical protein
LGLAFELRLAEIVKTVGQLRRRIDDRFHGSGLGKVCIRLEGIAERTSETTAWLQRPIYWLRLVAWLFAITVVTTTAVSFWQLATGIDRLGLTEFVQVSEAALNEIVLLGAAIFFLMTVERRFKRVKALAAIHELRSVAHVIDMHQLTKDPERHFGTKFKQMPSSPARTLSPFQLRRYLDYCSEMLSLVAKIGAVYAQDFEDPTVLSAVSDLETLTSSLSSKIWQKIMIVHQFGAGPEESNETPPNAPVLAVESALANRPSTA